MAGAVHELQVPNTVEAQHAVTLGIYPGLGVVGIAAHGFGVSVWHIPSVACLLVFLKHRLVFPIVGLGQVVGGYFVQAELRSRGRAVGYHLRGTIADGKIVGRVAALGCQLENILLTCHEHEGELLVAIIIGGRPKEGLLGRGGKGRVDGLAHVGLIDLEESAARRFLAQLPSDVVALVSIVGVAIDEGIVFAVATIGQVGAVGHALNLITGVTRQRDEARVLKAEMAGLVRGVCHHTQATVGLSRKHLCVVGGMGQLEYVVHALHRENAEYLVRIAVVLPLQQLTRIGGGESHVEHLVIVAVLDDIGICLVAIEREGPLLTRLVDVSVG